MRFVIRILPLLAAAVLATVAQARETKFIVHGWDCQSAHPDDVLASAAEGDLAYDETVALARRRGREVFSSVLVDNAANSYCSSHQAELARHCYIPAFEHYLDILKKRMLANDRTPPERKCLEEYRTRAMKLGFDKLRLKVPRTRESFNRALALVLKNVMD